MKDTGRPAPQWLADYTRNIFRGSDRKSLLLTGSKGAGKTTLFNALLKGAAVPGVRSRALRGKDGMPRAVALGPLCGGEECVIGLRKDGAMRPQTAALDGPATAMLLAAVKSGGEWAAVDEIGFLEEASEAYKAALERLFCEKRVLAVLRKADTPLLRRLRAREDCLLLDLDEITGGNETGG